MKLDNSTMIVLAVLVVLAILFLMSKRENFIELVGTPDHKIQQLANYLDQRLGKSGPDAIGRDIDRLILYTTNIAKCSQSNTYDEYKKCVAALKA